MCLKRCAPWRQQPFCLCIKNYIMSPSTYKEFGEKYEILVASKIVLGRIPMYYNGIMEKSSSIVSS